MIRLSATIVVFKTPIKTLLECIDSLAISFARLETSLPARMSIYVVDNSVCDSYSSKVKKALEETGVGLNWKVYFRVLNENVGYGAANNSVIQELNSDFHLVLNPDVRVSCDALLNSVSALSVHANAVLLSPKIANTPCGENSTVLKRYPSCFVLLLRYLGVSFLSKAFERKLRYYEISVLEAISSPQEVILAGGCFMFMQTEAFIRVGGFSEKFFMYFEDFDLSIRLAHLGKIVFGGDVLIEHDGGDVGRKTFSHHMSFSRSAITFFNTYGWKFF